MFESDVKAAHFGATMTEDVATKARMSFMMNIGFRIFFLVFVMMIVPTMILSRRIGIIIV